MASPADPWSDPCDGCGGKGVVRVTLTEGGVLMFCPSCWQKHNVALAGIGHAESQPKRVRAR